MFPCPGNSPAAFPLSGPRSTSQWPSISRPPMVSGGWAEELERGWGLERGELFRAVVVGPSWEPALPYSLASSSPKRSYEGLESQRHNQDGKSIPSLDHGH